MKSYVVVDASLAVKWVLREPYAEQALAVAKDWAARDIRPTAPCLLLVEVSNVLHHRTLLGQISSFQAHELLTNVIVPPVECEGKNYCYDLMALCCALA